MLNRSIHIFIIFALTIFAYTQQNTNTKANESLLNQAQQLIDERDFEKAKLTLKLYQKYVEKDLPKWLNAQLELVRSNIETNDFLEANKLLSEAEIKAKKIKPAKRDISDTILLLKAEIHEIKNDFYKAEEIYRSIYSATKSNDVLVRLANNLIDRVLAGYSKKTQQDYDEIRSIVTTYEKNDHRNPLELIRLKQKVSSYQMINKETLESHDKLSTYWIQKDEFILFKIYLNNSLRKYDDAYKLWEENKDLISLKTHPLSVPTLVNLSRHFLSTKPDNSANINKTLQVLIRDEKEKSLVNQVIIEQLIVQNKAAEALSLFEDFIKNSPKAHNKNAILVSLSAAFLEQRDFKTAKQLINSIPDSSLLSPEDKSQSVYISASLLQAEGKDLDAAVLFLRVGQTASNQQIALKSLFMAGKSFYDANQCNRAVIAFKMLLEKRRNKYTDKAMYFLSRSQAQCKNYKEALAVIDQIVIVGKDPELKKMALFEKGDYYLKAGDINKAIEAYNDYTVVYTDDSRNAAIWLKIYGIHRKFKDLESCEKMLSKIIDKSSKNSPEIYSQALHQKALIHQLKGDDRKSISLWQTFLEFNQKVQTPLSDEVKLMLAAAYQNSRVLNLDAARSIYLEIIENSQKSSSRNIAVFNLLKISDASSKSLSESLSKILTIKSSFDRSSSTLILDTAFSDFQKYKKPLKTFIAKIGNREHKSYWEARFLFEEKKYNDVISKLSKVNSEELSNHKHLLLKNTYMALKKPQEALSSCLEIIYSFSTDVSQKKYSSWDDLENAALAAVEILKTMGKYEQVSKIKDRILVSRIPQAEAIGKAIDKMMEKKK